MFWYITNPFSIYLFIGFLVPLYSRCNTSFPFPIFRPEKPFFFFTMRKVTKFKYFSTARKKRLTEFISRKGTEMRPCTNCIKSGERYIANREHDKYAFCTKGAKTCDLVIFKKNWDKLDAERKRLSRAVTCKKKRYRKPRKSLLKPFKNYRVLRCYKSC